MILSLYDGGAPVAKKRAMSSAGPVAAAGMLGDAAKRANCGGAEDPFQPQGAAQIGAVAAHVAGDALVTNGSVAGAPQVPSAARTVTVHE